MAAWSYELWNRMYEVKGSQYRRPRKDAQRQPHEFSRIIVCAACLRNLRVGIGGNRLHYYRDTSLERKLPCPAEGNLMVRSSLVAMQFGDILRSIELPDTWREIIVELCKKINKGDGGDGDRIRKRRAELEAEQKRVSSLYRKGYISDQELDAQMEELRSELFMLPIPESKDPEKVIQETLNAGVTLQGMAEYWDEATLEERRDIVWSLLPVEGLLYDLERHIIVGLRPRSSFLPVLKLGLEATHLWEQQEDMLWLRRDYWPPKKLGERAAPPSKLTPAQQEQAIMLIRQGVPLRKVAELFETSHELIRRLARSHGIVLKSNGQRLSPEQLEEAYVLLRAGVPLRKAAARVGISAESLRRLARRDGVALSDQTPTERKLTTEQQEEARALVRSGTPLRKVARQFGISRSALEGLLDEGDKPQQEATLTADQLQEARALLDAGYSLRQTARHFRTTHQTLVRHLKRENKHPSEVQSTRD